MIFWSTCSEKEKGKKKESSYLGNYGKRSSSAVKKRIRFSERYTRNRRKNELLIIVLDTDVLIEIFDKESAVGEEILTKIEGYEIATTSINLHEVLYGLYKVRKKILDELLEFTIVDFTRRNALLSAKLEVEVEKRGKPAGRFVTMIAAICINRDALLATLNNMHFERFSEFGLKLFLATLR